MHKETPKTPAQIWQETYLEQYKVQIAEWQKKHKAVHLYVTSDGTWAIIRRPTRQEMSSAKLLSNKDSNQFNEMIARDVWLAGDEIIFEEDKYFYGLTEKINELIEVEEGELVKL